MIIWINGSFGVGKTEVATRLNDNLPGSFLLDPEEIGGALFKTLPAAIRDDFQDIPLWRTFTCQTLRYVLHHYDGGPIIVPMTLVVPEYFREIMGTLHEEGCDVRHFTLMASKETIWKRLEGRGQARDSWAAKQVERCVTGLSAPEFAEHLDTEGRTIAHVVEEVARRAGLT